MKTWIMILFLSVVAARPTAWAQKPSHALVGVWLNEEKDGRIEIHAEGERFAGKIVAGKTPNRKDDKNPDPKLRSRPLIGLVILKDFRYTGDKTWEDGTIYDPNNGKTYDCKITMADAKTLKIRGFIGVSLFGRTTTWTRAE